MDATQVAEQKAERERKALKEAREADERAKEEERNLAGTHTARVTRAGQAPVIFKIIGFSDFRDSNC